MSATLPTMTYTLYERLPFKSTYPLRQQHGHSFHFTCPELRYTFTAKDRAAAEQGIREYISEHGGVPRFDGGHVIEDSGGKRTVSAASQGGAE